MSIEDRLADADILWKHGRHEGALLSVLVAVAATARKTFPEITGDRASFEAFMTTALRVLKKAWTQQHGGNSVAGLAPSAAAAAVLAEELGIGTENTAKWLYEHQQGHVRFSRGQLVIIDEATLAGTLTLDRITAHAEQAGAKVLLVGDWAQLQSVEAGGAFGMLVEARDDAPELVDIHRFTNKWEKLASIDLRHGRVDVVDTYIDHGRVDGGTGESMTEAAYVAWKHDVDHGKIPSRTSRTRPR